MTFDAIFQPLHFRHLTVKNRIFRSNVSGRFDNYDGSGSQARINWEAKFARGGVGAIISSFVPVSIRGRIVPNYATIDDDDKIPFWKALGDAVHEYDCRYILQLSHSGRQQDIQGVENEFRRGLSSTNKTESFHGLLCQAMTLEEIKQTVEDFAEGARRAREAGLDGVELHGANGYLITQFLSSGINDRKDEYGGPLENRARFVREIVRAIRKKVGRDFHLGMKISATEFNNAINPLEKKGNTVEDSVRVCKWLVEDGVDHVHVSTGSMFPHPRNPMGDFPVEHATRWYDGLLSSGIYTRRNYALFGSPLLRPIFKYLWHRSQNHPKDIEGANLHDARRIREAVREMTKEVPVICTGGFQTGARIEHAIERGDCDAVSIARPLIANNNMVRYFERGEEIPEGKRCTYCNKCLFNAPENPLGCYELSRFGGDYEEMIRQVMSVYEPRPVYRDADAAQPSVVVEPAKPERAESI
jgi:2,4-dienoyl-CoA reductase-like NADH-dependent reductase (Old Yellow Enzyme family)